MTSEVDSKQTNELLQRRRLRLQQVREQSKEIAKKIRQRTNVETLRQVKAFDQKKVKQYLDCQKQFVDRLQQLYSNGLENVGAGHRNASDHVQQEIDTKKDKSELRGIEAVAEVRRKKQEILNKKKELLDRKLQARDAANERSREKSNIIAKNLQVQVCDTISNNKKLEDRNLPTDIPKKVDMATQLDIDQPLNDGDIEVPLLKLPESESAMDGSNDKPEKLDKIKRPNLFALSDEMPSSLRCGTEYIPQEITQMKPSLTLVSEYIQNRRLRLRESDTNCNKKPTENLENIKQTILRTRASKTEGNDPNVVCDVLDTQFVSVPNWRAESEFTVQSPAKMHCNPVMPPLNSRKFKSVFNSSNNKINRTLTSKIIQVEEGGAFTNRNYHLRNLTQSVQESNKESLTKLNDAESLKKGSVLMYNHMTRGIKTVPYCNENVVIRDHNTDDDAFSKAQKQYINDDVKQTKLHHKIAEERRKVAVARENVDKEYRDTMAFLNSLPKDMSSGPNRAAYMDEKRQQQLKDNHERKLEQEYKNIDKEYKKHQCKHSKPHLPHRSKATKQNFEDLNDKKIQYSWMPVPEKERNLAIHNIPTTHKVVRHGNTVKFSHENDYHEYRSSHKHTPPTKDKSSKLKSPKNRYVETVLIEQNGNDSTDCTSITSDSSSTESIVLNGRENTDVTDTEECDSKRSETDRIIIYKILNAKNDKRKKSYRKVKLGEKSGNTVRPTQQLDGQSNDGTKQINKDADKIDNNKAQKVSFEELKEGIYRTVKENGDNMASLQFADKPVIHEEETFNKNNKSGPDCDHFIHQNTKGGDFNPGPNFGRSTQNCNCVSNTHNQDMQSLHYPSATTSVASLKTNLNNVNIVPPDGACMKLIDEGSQENSKFYVGTTGFLKNDAYEVIIQLRKKELHKPDEDSNRKRDELANNAKDAETRLPLAKSDVSVQADTLTNQRSTCTIDKESDETCPRGPTTTPSNSKDVLDISKIDLQQPVTNSNENQNIGKLSENVGPPVAVPPKQATSTYTQTTNSPIHRPILMQMSSSTSTAYMSPPDIIMPRFLKQNHPRGYNRSYDETGDSTTLNEPHNMHKCTCKHHGDNRGMARQTKTSNRCKKINSTQNSASSAAEIYGYFKKNHRISSGTQNSKKRHSCSKSKKPGKTMKTSKCDSNLVFNKNLQNIKCNNAMRNNKTALNPIIKAYVNKLLDLNKEGMKAVEIINQDCSSVPTPGSSIINNTLNVDTKLSDEKKISLEQIKNILKQNIISNQETNNNQIYNKVSGHYSNDLTKKNIKTHAKPNKLKRMQLHKVKSLNISKKLSKTNAVSSREIYDNEDRLRKSTSTSSSLKTGTSEQQDLSACSKQKCSRKSSMSPHETALESKITKIKSDQRQRFVTTQVSTDSENIPIHHIKHKKREYTPPAHISTQTSGTFDSDNNLMKVAEDKLQNMEKIADLTEKCTKRLSNLAKVLEEVRRNKSLAYSQITSSDSQSSDSDLERFKNGTKNKSPLVDYPELQTPFNKVSPLLITSDEEKEKSVKDSETFIPLLTDIPKPSEFKTPLSLAPKKVVSSSKEYTHHNTDNFKLRGKPPTALSRIHLRNEQEQIVPHELSTVLEVDSPMSLKHKSKSRIDVNADVSKKSMESVESTSSKEDRNHTILPSSPDKERLIPDVKSYPNTPKKNIIASTDSSDDSKLRMMDLKEFNEIMLKPFISIQEYTKKKNINTIDEAFTTIDNNLKDVLPDEDLSSLHSDSSIPDVIAELLKRKIINEPFKFDTASNVNTSSISSESTISLLALSNSRKERKKSIFQNKKYVSEMSDSLSISSNPDLEQAFQKLGMGWASSTLKKTKERLALSSSSNTSNSSGVQFRNNFTTADKSPRKMPNGNEVSKNAEQQTSLPNSMTVKEFLTNELAKKITFINKSKDDTEREFVSLFETKMPEQLKQIIRDGDQDQSDNGLANGSNNNRARTSTPVQIFRSMTYHSSSSTNTSNGLFSNADDLSSVKVTSNSIRNHSTSDKDDLTIPNYILRTKAHSDGSKSDN